MIKQVTCLLAATVLAGCATVSGQGALSHPSESPLTHAFPASASAHSPATHPKPVAVARSDNATLPAAALAAATKKAMLSATAFRMKGAGRDGQTKLAFDIHYGATSSIGSMTVDGVQLELCNVASAAYMKGPASAWRAMTRQFGAGGSLGNAVVDILAGKWVHIPTTAEGLSALVAITDRAKFLAEAASYPAHTAFSVGPRTTIHGVRAVSFVASGDHSVMYVPRSGTPFPVRSDTPGQGTVQMSAWNVPFTAPAPPADQVVEFPS